MKSTLEAEQAQAGDEVPVDWLQTISPRDWLLDEYKLLSSHFFHEDSQIQKTTGIYATLNGGLLAFLGSKLAAAGQISDALVPAVGIALCFSWLAALVRLREWRIYIERRIRHIEETLHRHWGAQEFLPLDFRTVRSWKEWQPRTRWFNWPYLLLRNVPSSLTLMFLPIAFGLVWAYLLARVLMPLLASR